MATVIDSLIVELGLDPKNFTKGQKDAAASVTNLEKTVEKSGKNISTTVNGVRNQILAMMAAFLAGRGIKEFIQDIATAEAATARLAYQLHTIPEELSAWRGAAILSGGSADGLTNSVQGLVSQFQQFTLTGESSVIPWFRALRVNITDVNTGKMRDFSAILLDLADRFQGMDPARAAAFGRALGFDQGTINLLIQGRKAVQAMLDEQKRLGVVTREDAEAGLKLQHSWLALQQSSESLGRTLLTDLTPALVWIFDHLTAFAEWARGHKPLLEAFFYGLAAAATALGIALFPTAVSIGLVSAAVLALIGVFALLFDDWKTWMDGGVSEFGWFYNSIATGLKQLVKNYSDSFKLIRDIVSGNFGAISQDWDNLNKDMRDGWAGTVHFVRKALSSDGSGKDLGGIPYASNSHTQGVGQLISRGEGGYDSVNLGARGGYRSGTADLTNMTIGQVMAAQAAGDFNAAGRYQIIKGTLSDAVRTLGIKSNEKFSTATQDRIFKDYLLGIKRAAIGDYISGKSNDLHAALKAGSEEWASIADPDTGASHYAGTGNNKASITSDEFAQALQTARGQNVAIQQAKNVAVASRGARIPAAQSTTHNNDTRIGTVVVNTQATDAKGIASDIKAELATDTFASQANYSVQ